MTGDHPNQAGLIETIGGGHFYSTVDAAVHACSQLTAGAE
jgi:hypothetical protein